MELQKQPKHWYISKNRTNRKPLRCDHSPAPRLGVWHPTLHQLCQHLLKAVKEKDGGKTGHFKFVLQLTIIETSCRVSSLCWNPSHDYIFSERVLVASQISL